MKRLNIHQIDPEGVADGDYVVTVAGGVVTGLTPASPGGGSGVVESIVPGSGIDVDDTDPANPIVSTTSGGGGGGSDLLAFVIYSASAAFASTSTTDADIDATNLAIAFTAPASGKVLVELCGTAYISSTAGDWTLRSGTTTLQAVGLGGGNSVRTARFYVSGLNPGTGYTYKWGHRRIGSSGSLTLYTGGNAGVNGAAMMSVRSMP